MVVAEPSVRTVTVANGDLLLLSCDGLFEPKEMTLALVVSMIEKQWKDSPKTAATLNSILQDLILQALRYGSQDNITATLVCLAPEQTSKEPMQINTTTADQIKTTNTEQNEGDDAGSDDSS